VLSAVSYFASFIGLCRERQGGIAVKDYTSPHPLTGLADVFKSFKEDLRGPRCLSTSHLFDGLKIMSLPFSALCELWEQLSSTRKTNNSAALVREWFERQAPNIIQQGRSALALLSCLFPHRRPDRVYGLRERRLTDITVRAWGLGSSRRHELQRLQDEEGLDFASAVQSVVEDGGDPPQSQPSPTVEEVDGTLDLLASACDFSSPELRNRIQKKSVEPSQELIGIFRRMRGLEVKWMIRVLLKDLGPAHVPETSAMQLFHPLFPRALEVRRSLSAPFELLDPCPIRPWQVFHRRLLRTNRSTG
jgi:DNA ligase-4